MPKKEGFLSPLFYLILGNVLLTLKLNKMLKIERKGGVILLTDLGVTPNKVYEGTALESRITTSTTQANVFYFKGFNGWNFAEPVNLSQLVNQLGNPFETIESFTNWRDKNIGVSSDVYIQDQTSGSLIGYFIDYTAVNQLAAQADQDNYTIILNDSTGFSANEKLVIYDTTINKYCIAGVLSVVPETNTLTLDTPIDRDFPVDSIVGTGNIEMNVDGSTTAQIFGIRATASQIPTEFDVTMIRLTCITNSEVDYNEFANVSKLLRGIVVRKVNADDTYKNIFNAKSNSELDLIGNWQPITSRTPSSGSIFGFIFELDFKKLGIVKRLKQGENLQVLIQDNLTGGSIISLIGAALGHEVENN